MDNFLEKYNLTDDKLYLQDYIIKDHPKISERTLQNSKITDHSITNINKSKEL